MDLLSREDLRALIEEGRGPCASLFLPTHRVGEATQQDPIRLKNLLREAEGQPAERGLRSPEARQLLAAAREFVSDTLFWSYQADGLALFISPDAFRRWRLPIRLDEMVVVVQKSLREGGGLTVTEAMWKGTPVIGGNVGGIRHQIEDEVNGFLVDSVEEAAQRMSLLLRDEDLRREIGQRAQATVRERYLMTALLERYLDLFNDFEPDFRLKTVSTPSRADGRDAQPEPRPEDGR